MKGIFHIIALSASAAVSVMALPASPGYATGSLTPYEQCVADHGGQAQFPYPGPGECHTMGHCECLQDGSIGCVC
ncbi:hypothetical protein EV183_001247 [Coemansia sp. RSA 2336]|nr:hypothetical protein EV183_001247 [Coemansia sp. RSA 2336]